MDGLDTTPSRKVLIFAPSFEPAVAAGGPARSLTNLASALSAEYRLTVVTADRDLGSSRPFRGLSGRWTTRRGAEVFYLNVRSVRQWLTVGRELRAAEFDLILLNSIWNLPFSAFPALGRLMGLLHGPIVLMPRGELDPGALAHRARRKRLLKPLAKVLYRKAVIGFAATSEAEAQAVGTWYPSVPIVLTTNIPEPIEFGVPADQDSFLRLVFVSRVHPKKGLLQALQSLRFVTRPTRLKIAGPIDDRAYWEECCEVIDILPAHVRVDYLGLVGRDELPALLWSSDATLFLTAGENYGHVIAESLQAGCPVITTATTPWTGVIRAGGGRIVEDPQDSPGVASIIDAWAARSNEAKAAERLAALQAYRTYSAASRENVVGLAFRTLLAPHRDSDSEGGRKK